MEKTTFDIKDFKSEFRLMCTDTWGEAIEAWFEATGHLFTRGLHIPAEYAYSPTLIGSVTEEDSFFHDYFSELSDEDLITVTQFLFRYCRFLESLKRI